MEIDFGNGQVGREGIIVEVYHKRLPSGRLSKRRSFYFLKYTPLYTCELCGRVSVPKRIQYRWDCWGWLEGMSGLLCMSCWCKVQRLMCIESSILELKKEINKVSRRRRKNE